MNMLTSTTRRWLFSRNNINLLNYSRTAFSTISKSASDSNVDNRGHVTPLQKIITQQIKAVGPMTVAEYMRLVLTNPISGFYMKQDVFGKKGHFTTSPEISQIFGELIGAWLINEWRRFGSPKPFRIVELGPGRGTMANNITSVLSQFSSSREAVSLHLVEISPYLTQIQEQNLCGSISVIEKERNDVHNSLTKTGIPVTWYQALEQIPEKSGFTAYIAHELLDAFPIHKFQKNAEGKWREILIDFNENGELCYVLARHETPASKLFIEPSDEGNHLEKCPDALALVNKIAMRINRNDGCCLICDYGFDQESGIDRDTFRAFRDHKLHDPLKEPGTADLTADVDFLYLKKFLDKKVLTFGPVTQAYFLQCLGIDLRLHKLLQNANEDQKKQLISGVEKLINEMGKRFKFLSLFPNDSIKLFDNNPPAGFASHEV